jgi:hypothetical protein
MCIFSGSVESVSSTKILASRVYQAQIVEKKEKGEVRKYKKPTGNPMQLTVYSNKTIIGPPVSSSGPGPGTGTAMILPFPLIKGQNRVKVLDMSKYENFFDDIELLFPLQDAYSNNVSYQSVFTDSQIDVLEVGNYKVSIVPNFDSIMRLRFDAFNLTPDVADLLSLYYKKDYGFMVCILKQQASYHPFAYVHEMRSNGELFIPTRHHHGHAKETPYSSTMNISAFGKFHDRGVQSSKDTEETGLKNEFYDTLMDDDDFMSQQIRRSKTKVTRERESKIAANAVDWDHDIYIVNRPLSAGGAIIRRPGTKMIKASDGRLSQVANYINFKRMPTEVSFGDINSLFKITIGKMYTSNHDLFI